MPLPRKKTAATTVKKKPAAKKKASAPVSRAKRGERLLVTCAPGVPEYIMNDLAQTLHGAFFDGGQVVAVRIDERTGKIYGKMQAMYEAAPFMFVPL